jgi:hypothetical protein
VHLLLSVATKAERFRAEQERSGPKRAPKPEKLKRARVVPNSTAHNLSLRAAKKGVYAVELSMGARPSRKSSRKSKNHVKTDTAMRMTAVSRATSPEMRAHRRG